MVSASTKDSSNALNRTAWKMPNNEPAWYYDLHPVGHNLRANNGEVPALLSAHLRAKLRGNSRLHDIDEVDILRDGKAIVGLDLVACMDDSIIIAECKRPGNLGADSKAGLREIYKKCDAAKYLRADTIIFATAAPQWETATQEWRGSDDGSSSRRTDPDLREQLTKVEPSARASLIEFAEAAFGGYAGFPGSATSCTQRWTQSAEYS